MKRLLLACICLILTLSLFSQHNRTEKLKQRLPSPPPERLKSTTLPPIRGMKDLRPKQFQNVSQVQFASVDLSPKIKSLRQIKMNEKTQFPVANLVPLEVELVNKQDGVIARSYSFRVLNPEYKGAFVFINESKDAKTGKVNYFGHFVRPGFSDALKLITVNGRMYFAVEEHEKIVQD